MKPAVGHAAGLARTPPRTAQDRGKSAHCAGVGVGYSSQTKLSVSWQEIGPLHGEPSFALEASAEVEASFGVPVSDVPASLEAAGSVDDDEQAHSTTASAKRDLLMRRSNQKRGGADEYRLMSHASATCCSYCSSTESVDALTQIPE